MVRDKRSFTTTAKNYKQLEGFELTHYGLVNLGNSCFYNSIIQSLSVTRPLIEFVNSSPAPSSSPILQSLSSTSFDSIDEAISTTPIPLSIAFVALLKRLKLAPNGKKTFNPSELLKVLSRKHPDYSGQTQEDANELLCTLLDSVLMEEVDVIKKLKNSLNKPKRSRRQTIVPSKPILIANGLAKVEDVAVDVEEEGEEEEEDVKNESDSESSSDSDSDVEANATTESDSTFEPFVESIFRGKLESFIVCSTCSHVSLSSEDFLDLSLSLKEDPTSKLRKRDRLRKTLQTSFFSKKSDSPSQLPSHSLAPSISKSRIPSPTSSGSSISIPPPQATPINISSSLSETESISPYASASEAEGLTDEDRPINKGEGVGLGRSQSLDPSKHLNKKPFWANSSSSVNTSNSSQSHPSSHLNPTNNSSANSLSRDSSPLGRALSTLSSGRSKSSRSRFTSKPKIPKPTSEQVAYVKKILKEIQPTQSMGVASQLRWSSPDRRENSNNNGGGEKFNGGKEEQIGTDLYDCLVSFTSVEVLEGENKFACTNCWKLLNPDLVARIKEARESKKEEKLARRFSRRSNATSSIATREEKELEVPVPASSSVENLSLDELDLASTTPRSTSFLSSNSLDGNEASVEEEEDPDMDSGNLTDTSIKSKINIIPPTPTPTPLTTANVDSLTAPSTNSISSHKDSSSKSTISSTTPSIPRSNSYFHSNSLPLPKKSSRHILRDAHKRYLMSPKSLPPVLVIQFKRFQQTSKGGYFFGAPFTSLKKRDDALTFSMRLDLKEFLAPEGKAPKNGEGINGGRGRANSSGRELEKVVDAVYELYSVVVHSGSLKEGHYISYVLSDMFTEKSKRGLTTEKEEKDAVIEEEEESEKESISAVAPRTWIYTSDHEVRLSSLTEVMNCKAYMLFYERVASNDKINGNNNLLVKSHI